MITIPRWLTRNSLVFGGIALWGVVLIGCVSVNRTVLAPPKIAGAEFVGDKGCVECHANQTSHFKSSSHSRVALADPKLGPTGCETCHGPGSLHAKAGGGKNNIINPGKSPETCFQCHVDKRGQFSLPHTHAVMAGHVSCSDCHEPHSGEAIKGAGASLETMNETCIKCHTAQKGPFVFEHGGVKMGCVSCHNAHGSVNAKMLVARDANLCLQCHLTANVAGAANLGQINVRSNTNVAHTGEVHNSLVQRGACWSAGCHEAIHGSNVNNHFRY